MILFHMKPEESDHYICKKLETECGKGFSTAEHYTCTWLTLALLAIYIMEKMWLKMMPWAEWVALCDRKMAQAIQ
jgi:hypothetical protein